MDQFDLQKKKANVVFLGGEPTLHPDLAAAAAYAKQTGYSSVTIDTNGYLFNDILNKTTPDIVDYFSFSLDGVTRQTNDAIRGKGSYEKCLEGIKASVAKEFKTSLIYTVSTANIGEVKDLPEFASGLGIDKLFIQVLGVRGKSAKKKQSDKKIEQVSRQQWRTIIPQAAQKSASQGISVVYPKVYLDNTETVECAGVVAENYFIFPNGRVYRCPLCEDYPFHSLIFKDDLLTETPPLNETDFFSLSIPEGCVFNKLVQPDNLGYQSNGLPEYKIACCMLKEAVPACKSSR